MISQDRMQEDGENSEANRAAVNWTVDQPTNENLIRLVLLDDHVLFRSSLARLLASDASFEVAGECGTLAEAFEAIRESHVDLVLLDFDVGPDHANDLISRAREAGYRGRFLIIAGTVDAERSAMVLKVGASGVFLKSEGPERLIQAIRVIATGRYGWIKESLRPLPVSALACHAMGSRNPPAHWMTANKE